MAAPVIELREGGVQDVPAVDGIMRAAFDPEYGEAWTPAQCLGMMALPGVWLVVAAIDGVDLGFALSRVVADEAELLLIATHPDARRRGVARALIGAVADEAAARGVVTLHLEVRSGNPAAQLYLAEGFAKVGERKNYYKGKTGNVFDAHSYARNLR